MRTTHHALCASLAMLVYGTACTLEPEEPERTSDPISTHVRGEPEVDCVQHVEPPQLSAEWLDTKGSEPARLADGSTRLAIFNRSHAAAEIEVRLKLESGGETYRSSAPLHLAGEGSTELQVSIASFGADLRKTAYSAQLLAEVVALSAEGRILHKTSAAPAYLHLDRQSGATLLYSEDLLVARFRGGDLEGRSKQSPNPEGESGGVGVARVARASDLFGDPDDMRMGEIR